MCIATGAPTGNPEEMLLGFSPAINQDRISANLPIRPAPGCGDEYWVMGADDRAQIIRYITEGGSQAVRVLLDQARTNHTFFAEPLGAWPNAGDCDPAEDAIAFQATRAGNVNVAWDVGSASEIVATLGDSGQLSGWGITGMTRWTGCNKHNGSSTEGELTVTLVHAGGVYTVSLYRGVTLVAQGSRSNAAGSVTLAEVDSSGVSAVVVIAYTADITSGCVVVKRWPASYLVEAKLSNVANAVLSANVLTITHDGTHVFTAGDEVEITSFTGVLSDVSGTFTVATVTSSTTFTITQVHANGSDSGTVTWVVLGLTFTDPGSGESFETTLGPLDDGTYRVDVTPISETGVESINFVTGNVTISGAPEAPGAPSYVSGNITNTVIQFAASATAGATYRLYDCQALGGPTFLETIAATRGAGTGTLTLTLPSLSAGSGGERWMMLVAVSGGVEDGVRRKFMFEYDAAGNYVVAAPNVPSVSLTSVSGRTVSLGYTYDSTGAEDVATGIVLKREDEAGAVVTAAPVALSGSGPVYSGTLSSLGIADTWYRFAVAARTAGAVLSAYSAWTDWIYVSTTNVAAPSGLVLTPVS